LKQNSDLIFLWLRDLLARYINYTWCGGRVVSLPARAGVVGEGGVVTLWSLAPGDGQGFLTVSA